MSTFSGDFGLGFSWSQGRGLDGGEKEERSGSEEGMMCVCMSILNSDDPEILGCLRVDSWLQVQQSMREGDIDADFQQLNYRI